MICLFSGFRSFNIEFTCLYFLLLNLETFEMAYNVSLHLLPLTWHFQCGLDLLWFFFLSFKAALFPLCISLFCGLEKKLMESEMSFHFKYVYPPLEQCFIITFTVPYVCIFVQWLAMLLFSIFDLLVNICTHLLLSVELLGHILGHLPQAGKIII